MNTEQMGKIEDKSQNGRFKPNHIKNYVRIFLKGKIIYHPNIYPKNSAQDVTETSNPEPPIGINNKSSKESPFLLAKGQGKMRWPNNRKSF